MDSNTIRTAIDRIASLRKARQWLEEAQPEWFDLMPRAETTAIGNRAGYEEAKAVMAETALQLRDKIIQQALIDVDMGIAQRAELIRNFGNAILTEEANRKSDAS